MTFINLLNSIHIDYAIIANKSESYIQKITLNSRTATHDAIFSAIVGFHADGHDYIKAAYTLGCRNFLISTQEKIDLAALPNSTIVLVEDSRLAHGLLSRAVYAFPDQDLHLVGITGTKGKTTVTTLLHHILSSASLVSMFSTIRYQAGTLAEESERTTLEADVLQSLFRRSLDDNYEEAVVEVSSHALTLSRVAGVEWDAGVFTSFSRDHLDLYETMENYLQAKIDFFRALNRSQKPNKFAIINVDDYVADEIISAIDDSVRIITVGFSNINADYRILSCEATEKGQLVTFAHKEREYVIDIPLKGKFNANNVLLCVAMARAWGLSFSQITQALNTFEGVEGRFDLVINRAPFSVVVDYAHTPDSLEKIIEECRMLAGSARVITVFGCTGDRDREKRPLMAEVVGSMSDYAIITDDDTYSESSEAIIAMIEPGFVSINKHKGCDYDVIASRKDAITRAMSIAKANDVILVAGMGHQRYQVIGDSKVPWNDREAILDVYNLL